MSIYYREEEPLLGRKSIDNLKSLEGQGEHLEFMSMTHTHSTMSSNMCCSRDLIKLL